MGYTDSKDKSLLNLRKNKASVDKGIHNIDAGIFNSFLAAAKKEGVNVPDKLAKNDFKLFRERGHSLIVDHGWREVAEYSLAWLNNHGL